MPDYSVTHTAAYGVQAYASALTRPEGDGKAASFDPTSPPPTTKQPGDQVSLSQEGKELSNSQKSSNASTPAGKKSAGSGEPKTKGSNQQTLNPAELHQIEQLKSRDIEVRAHEQAHLSAAGQYASGGPTFSYQTGPDSKQYAIGGSVPIDLGKEPTPEATVIKMRTVKRAALAPADPSAADRQIAAQAEAQEMQAIQEEMQATEATATQGSSLQSTDVKKSTSTADQGAEKTPKSQNPLATTKEPSMATRAMMNAAYQTMASLA